MKTIWTKDRCLEEALKFKTKNDFRNNSPSAYNKSLKRKWINDICTHMNEIKKPRDYWTKEECHKESLKYSTRSEFNRESVSAYSKAWEKNWLDDICNHMKYCGNKFKRCIYVYEFSDKHAYVGLTFNIDTRNQQHSKRGPVFNHIKSTNLNPEFKKITDYINVDDAKIKELDYINLYKKNGWKLLNSAKPGACGGGDRKWTKEKCEVEALKYSNVGDYKKNSLSYRAAVRNKWLDDICTHMNRKKNPYNYWTKEKCQEEALKFKTRKEFELKFRGGYAASRINGWLDEICSHMNKVKVKPAGYWTKEKCHEESIKYKYRSDFQKGSISAYTISVRNKWLDEICQHMFSK